MLNERQINEAAFVPLFCGKFDGSNVTCGGSVESTLEEEAGFQLLGRIQGPSVWSWPVL